MPSFFPRRTFLLGVEFQASNSPPVSTWAVCHCLLPRWFLMRNCCHSSCFPFHVRCFFLLTFTIFCFVSSFQRVWLWSVLAWISLDLSQCSLIFLNMGVYVSFFFFARFVRFPAIISLSPFLGLSSFSFSSRTWVIWMIDFVVVVMVFQVLDTSHVFFFFFF